MDEPAAETSVGVLHYEPPAPAPVPSRGVIRSVLLLALPVMAEQVLHMAVGLTDTYLANHLGGDPAAPTAAVGTMAYILWFIGLIVGSIGTGSTAIIARATGARHKSLANQVAGQSVAGALLVGIILGTTLWLTADWIVHLTGLSAEARDYARSYLQILAFALPFSMPMFIANACLRGAGDTLRPAIVMVVVDLANVLVSFALTYGWFGLPALGFPGIAIGTTVSYIIGGLLAFSVLKRGNRHVRLFVARMRPHWQTVKRILRIGLPSAAEGLLAWSANFAVVIVINAMDKTSVAAAAHINTIRIESISFLSGMAFATAAATLVGQNLGRRDPHRAAQSAYAAFGVGGLLMTLMGLIFITMPTLAARLLSEDPRILELTAQCLFITGFCQIGFAANMIFGGALRGAGDTFAVMLLNLASVLTVRLIGVLIVGWWLDLGLVAIWIVLASELLLRGVLIYARFLHGGWKHVKV
jgi:multidrug resistance protein, MATE family